MATSVTPTDQEAPIFAMLNAQPFTLHIAFINTIFTCTDVTVMQVKDINLPIDISSCNENDSSVVVSLLLPSHTVNLEVQLADIHNIGDLFLGLEGPGADIENDTLNATYTLVDLFFQFSAFWLPAVSDTLDQMFVNEHEYKYVTSSNTVLSIVINETPYYTSKVRRLDSLNPRLNPV